MRSLTRRVDADAADIWRWLTTPELMSRWIQSVDNLRTDDSTTVHRDSVLRFTARGKEHTTTVAEFDPGKCLLLRSVQGPVTADYRYGIRDDKGTCDVTLAVECRSRGWARLVGPLIGFAAWHTDKGQIDRLKSLVELSSEVDNGF